MIGVFVAPFHPDRRLFRWIEATIIPICGLSDMGLHFNAKTQCRRDARKTERQHRIGRCICLLCASASWRLCVPIVPHENSVSANSKRQLKREPIRTPLSRFRRYSKIDSSYRQHAAAIPGANGLASQWYARKLPGFDRRPLCVHNTSRYCELAVKWTTIRNPLL